MNIDKLTALLLGGAVFIALGTVRWGCALLLPGSVFDSSVLYGAYGGAGVEPIWGAAAVVIGLFQMYAILHLTPGMIAPSCLLLCAMCVFRSAGFAGTHDVTGDSIDRALRETQSALWQAALFFISLQNTPSLWGQRDVSRDQRATSREQRDTSRETARKGLVQDHGE